MSPGKSDWSSDPTVPSEFNITADHDDWRTLRRELHFDGQFAKVFLETVITPTRPEGITWTVVRRKKAVVVAAKTVDDRWLLIRQERIAIRAAVWEFPAGQIDVGDLGHSDFPSLLQETVWRELREETGYGPGPDSTLTPLGIFFPSVGFTDEHAYLFLADRLLPHDAGAQHEETESILECRAFTSQQLREMIATSEIRDANTLSTYARLSARGLL